jgi:type IV pilus assembly protein PilQ
VAEAYLKQLDLRQRQVALSLKILDVDLNNDAVTDNSFAYRWGNSFIVNDSGQLLGAFGRNLPPNSDDFNRSSSPNETIAESSGNSSSSGNSFISTFTLDNKNSLSDSQVRDIEDQMRDSRNNLSVVSTSPGESGNELRLETSKLLGNSALRNISDIIENSTGRRVERVRTSETLSSSDRNVEFSGGRRRSPGSLYPSNNFYDFVRAQIISNTTKVLASPTLILQENPSTLRPDEGSAGGNAVGQQGITNIGLNSPIGRRRANEGVVRVGTNVVTGYDVETPSQGGNVVCTPDLTTAGLVLGARVEKIDDNGFVTFTISPSISAVTDEEEAPAGCGSTLKILSVRSLDTGAIRVRDGQTLILTGVISDLDREEVTKWPIVGDLPLVGQFFRSSGKTRQKRELVIMVTPRIVNDVDGGTYGYGWQPSTTQSRELMRGVR